MIQELLGGAGLIGGERKNSITTGVVETSVLSPNSHPSSASASPSPSPSSTVATPTSSSTSESQKLRCPRCDSSNTKFCYYNNYNLTQPRHFCKTCRRYWTKGGALRNVPIGGGCRKNKNHPGLATPAAVRSSAGRYKAVSPEFGKSASLVNGFCQELPTNPTSWAFPHNSHFLSLLRATTPNPNPNPSLYPMSNISGAVKEEAGVTINGSIMSTKAVGLDLHSSQVGSNIGVCSSSFQMRNNHQQAHHYQHHNDLQQHGFVLGEVLQNTPCIQELYQRLRSSTIYHPDHSPPCPSINATSSSSSSPPIAPLAGGELGYWNLALPWSDLPTTTNGAYP